MHYLKVLCLAYLLCVQLTTSDDVLSEIKHTTNHVKRQHHEKGCTTLQGSTSCKLPAVVEETRFVDTDKSYLPLNTECVTYDGCYTCMEGSWVTSSCPEEHHHRGKRFLQAFLAVVEIISGIVGIIQAGVEIYCTFFCKGDDGEEYRPPQFTSCDGPASPINTPSGERAAVVTWQKPAYQEGNAGEPKLMLVSTSGDSGNTFEAGYYTITYHLVDNQGYKDSCSFSFQVKVRTCPWPGYLPNGQIVCGSGDIMYGDKCQVSCNQGYHLEGLSTITCEANENFNADLPTCQPKQCPVLGTPPHSTDFSCTDGDNYNSVCTLTCDSAAGFSSSPRLTICQEDTNWLQPVPRCKDTLKPEFTNCPSQAIQAYADRGKTTAVVIWKPPIASDNSGNVTVEQVAGLQPGQTFNEGSSMIKYTATDPSGQKAYCIFAVNVVTISCELPSFSDDNLMFDCTHGYRYGSQCTVSCKAGLPLNGTNTIVCEKDNSLSPVTYWDLGGGIPPYCIKRPCAVLTAPKHGALSCDNNMGGSFCTMSCEANWDIPRSAISVSMYTCGWAKGNWIPTADVPDCTAKHVANRLRLKSELNYYSGNCSDPSTLAEIKQKFVLVLDNSGLWTDGCPCTVEDVTVICGEARRRRRRRGVDIHEDKVEKRSTVPAAIITWHWSVPIQNGSISSADEQLIARAERMFSLVRNNQLDIGVAGFEVKPGSFGYGESNLVCPPGYLGTYRTGTCSPCPTGMMYSKTANDCVRCPLGTYQDEEGQFQCKPCPDGFKTIVGGARTQDKCIELCPAGQYSNSSVVPCDGCPVGKYQPDAGSSACLSCDLGTITSRTASTSASACQSFDVIVDGPATILSKGGLDANTDDWTISMWMSTRSAKGSIEIKQPDGTLPFKLTFGQTSMLSLLGVTVSDMNVPTSRWIHVSVVYKHGASTVTVYKNGFADSPRTTQSVPSPVFRSGSKLQVTLQTQSDITIRSVFVIPSALSPTDVQLLASSCGNKPNTFSVSINDLIAGSSPETVRVTTPTTCDAVDECQHNSPCNGHTCINLPDSYRCECQDGYSGSDCSVSPNYCANNKCQHGTCETGQNNYTCSCNAGFKGHFCDEIIVHGGWGNWPDWDLCSVTCGGGTQTRRRRCDNPSPTRPEGKVCVGSDSQTRACNTDECPVCRAIDVRRGIGSEPRCNGTSSALDCVPVCKNPSHVVDVKDKLVVKCRNGEWDSERPKVASCTEVIAPSELRLTYKSALNPATCLSQSEISDLKSSITTNTGGLQCSTDASCHTTVDVQSDGCSAGGRKRRSVGTTVTITLTSNIPAGDLQLAEFVTSKTVSPQLQKLVDAIQVLEKSGQQLQNSSSMYDVTVDGIQYSVVKDSVTVKSGIQCPAGAAVRNMLCVYCTPGTYSQGDKCTFCEVGTYQDEIGRRECKQCPSGKSTQFTGSTGVEACTVPVHITTPADGNDDDDDHHGKRKKNNEHTGSLIGLAVGLAVAFVVIVALVGIVVYKKCYRKQMKQRMNSQEYNSLNEMRSRSQASLGQIAPMVHSTSLHQTADATNSFQSATKTSCSFHDSSIPQSMDLPPSYEQVMSIPLQQPPAQTRLTPVHTQFTPVQAETNSVTKHDPLAFREPSIKAECPFASGVYERKLLRPRLPPLNLDGRNASDDYDKLQASSCRQTISGDYEELQVPPKHSVLGVNRQNGLANVYSEIAADKIIGATPTTPRDYEKSEVSRKPAPHGAERQGTSGKNDTQELPANLPSLDAAAVQHAGENVYSEIDDDKIIRVAPATPGDTHQGWKTGSK